MPATGLILYDIDLERYYQYNGTAWEAFDINTSGTTSGDVPSSPSIGQRYFDEGAEILYIYTSAGWAAVDAATAVSSPYGDNLIDLVFGTASGNSIEISSWNEDGGFVGYVILMNNENSFTSLVDGETAYESTTYASNGQQVVFDGASTSNITVTILEESRNYYFKMVPYASGRDYDNSQSSELVTTSSCDYSSGTDGSTSPDPSDENYDEDYNTTTESQICYSIDVESELMTILSNQYPDHKMGSTLVSGKFPNAYALATQQSTTIDYTPELSGSTIYVYSSTDGPYPSNEEDFYRFGFATNGLGFNPMGLIPWTNPDTDEENWGWQSAVDDQGETDLDPYGGHVTTIGVNHYHGDVVLLAPDEDGSKHSVIYGWAADGFPIYYKYGYTDPNDPTSAVIELTSSYQVKSGARTDTGTAGEDYPDGDYDGTYIQDHEYDAGYGDLDECNGRYGVTSEYPEGTYYYVITSDFPKVPNCFKGTPSDDFKIGN